MTEDNGTPAPEAKDPAPAPAPEPREAEAPATAATAPADTEIAEEKKVKIGALFKIIRNAVDLAGMNSSAGLLQVGAFLIDEACERSKRTHAEGIDQVKLTLAKVQAERDDAGAIVDQLMELIAKVQKPRSSSPEAAPQG